MRCFKGIVFAALGLLAGCAGAHVSGLENTSQGYAGQVVAVRPVTGGAVTEQITKILGQPYIAQPETGQELVIRLADGEVKSFVPPQGAIPTGLVVGDNIVITEAPSLKISLR